MREHAVPILPARDLAATLAFYERLGFEQAGTPWEAHRYLIVERGPYELHFFEAPDVDPRRSEESCYLRVADADALHEEWRALGIRRDPETGSRLVAPVDTAYGMREFGLVDPNGNLLRVGSERRP